MRAGVLVMDGQHGDHCPVRTGQTSGREELRAAPDVGTVEDEGDGTHHVLPVLPGRELRLRPVLDLAETSA